MEDESGLELSLGLSCGGSSVKPKSKNGSSSDSRAEDVGRGGKMADDFKSMFDSDPQKPESITGTRRTDSSKPEENFFSDLSKGKEDNASLSINGRGFLLANNNKPIDIEDDNRLEVVNKRKMSFDEIRNSQKKRESDVRHADLLDRARGFHISVTEDGSTAENEDVADSEAENTTSGSRPFSHHTDSSKGFIRLGSSDATKEVRQVVDSSAIDFNGQKRFNASTEKDFKHANMSFGSSFSVQPVNMMNVPYTSVKESNPVGAPSSQIPGVMHVMPSATGERQGAQSVNNGSFPMMFGYPSVQLPMLDKDGSWGSVPRPQQFHPSFAARGPPNSAALHINNVSEAMPYEGRPLDRTKGDGKQRVTEDGSSSQPEDVKGSSTNLRAKDVSEQSKAEGSSVAIDFSNIKPGLLAADVKFGGCGSIPNLPWVSTTGSGSTGRTISGITYRYSTNQIKIVCACHGSHMTPEEFVRHANDDQVNPEGNSVLGTVANGNPSASPHG